jgi:hypothetical protein
MEHSEAKIKFSNGEFEISGSESFVTKQIAEFKTVMLSILSSSNLISGQNLKALTLPESTVKLDSSNHSPKLNKTEEFAEFIEVGKAKEKNFDNVFVTDGDKIHIVCDIPGTSLAKRMINLVLIYLFIKEMLNVHEVSFNELREVCEKHGEIDKPNFAKHMQMQKKYFIVNGSGKNLSAKIIRPGIKEAETLIEELNNAS